MEALPLQTETMELVTNPEARSKGIVLVARVEKRLSVVMDCVVRIGHMLQGDMSVSGTYMEKVKFLTISE